MRGLALFAFLPGHAVACALELILATDVSGSIDHIEYAVQAEGLAAAFEDQRLWQAVELLEGGMIVTHMQWSGTEDQRQTTAWHKVSDPASAQAFASAIRAERRIWRDYSTAIGMALQKTAEIGRSAPEICKRRVIDVSGDGVSNEGEPPRAIADDLAAQGYTINGLAIRGAVPDPAEFYRTDVIAGPGAFVEVATGFEDYPEAILRKLLREIDPPLAVSHAAQE